MPTYCYRCDTCGKTNEVFERTNPPSIGPVCCQHEMYRDYQCELNPSRHVRGAGWPVHSDALAVHPGDVTGAREDAKKAGIPTDFDGDGRPVLKDPTHMKRYHKHCGVHHKNIWL